MATPRNSGMRSGEGDSDSPDQGNGPHLQVDLVADPLAVRRALMMLGTRMRERGVPQARIDDTQIVLAEVLNNIAEHAYDAHEIGRIHVDMWLGTDHLSCLIRDRGNAMPSNRLPLALRPEIEDFKVQDLPEGGFGWLLIHEMTAILRYRRVDGENRLFMQIGVGGR